MVYVYDGKYTKYRVLVDQACDHSTDRIKKNYVTCNVVMPLKLPTKNVKETRKNGNIKLFLI